MLELAIFEGGASGKARGVVAAFPDIWKGTVIDAGCRSRDLKQALKGRDIRYVGVDIDPNAEVVADLGQRLPFDDDSADVVTALDVLEHTNEIYHAFSELCRASGRWVVITLANCYEVGARIRHLRGKSISAKYGLPVERPDDRHRWFFSMDDARAFVEHHAAENGFSVTAERAIIGSGRAKFSVAAGRWPNMMSQTYLCLLERACLGVVHLGSSMALMPSRFI